MALTTGKLWVLVAAMIAGLVRPAGAMPDPIHIYGCGLGVPAGQIGMLESDLDCAGIPDGVLVVRGTLMLNGHSIKGATNSAISCHDSCRIVGPGDIEQSRNGIVVNARPGGRGRVRVTNVSIHDNSFEGLYVVGIFGEDPPRASVLLKDVIANDNGQTGIGVQARRVRATDITANGNGGVGFLTEWTARSHVSRLTALGNFLGLANHSGRAVVEDSTITGSTFTDVYSVTRPVLIDTTCDHSLGQTPDLDHPDGIPWGVCRED